jgi:hypothetical protein
MCKTNPICPRRTGRRGRRRSQSCETNPISGGWPDPSNGLCKTEPILPAVPGGMGSQGHGAWGKCAKQTQFVPARRNRWGKPEPRTQFVAFGSPIHPTRGHNCAKQTQFSPAGKQTGSLGGNNAEQSQFPLVPGGARPGGRGPWGLCNQSQFPREIRAGTRSLGRIAQNKANFRFAGVPARGSPRRPPERIVRNKANSPRSARQGKFCWEKELW